VTGLFGRILDTDDHDRQRPGSGIRTGSSSGSMEYS